MLDLTIAIANIAFFVSLLAAYLLRSALIGRRRHARADADGGSVFLNKRTLEMVYWILDPVIDFHAALRITPNMVPRIRRHEIAKILQVRRPPQLQLLQIIDTSHRVRLRFSIAQSWQQHRRQNCNNRDHHQQLDQSKTTTVASFRSRTMQLLFHWQNNAYQIQQ